ncbi:MAG: ABC transporter permease [Clostridia bacterium]|nr:ABC transporter permease [Clostridia bacterium]
MQKTLIAFGSILKKDIQNYYLKPPNISWGIIFPLSWALMQFISSSGSLEMRQLLPGLMAMSVLFGTTSMLAVTITFERRGRSFDRLLLAPISISTLVMAKLSGAILFGMLNAFIPVFLAAYFIDLTGINWYVVLTMLFLCGLFIPIEKLPTVLKPISFCLPLTYGTDILKGMITGNAILHTLVSFSVLLTFCVVLFYLCQLNIKRKWIL